MITFKQKGDFEKTTKYLIKAKAVKLEPILRKYGEQGVAALQATTPRDTGLTANSWYYEIERSGGSVSIAFYNSNIQNGIPIAIILQYGHGTGTGGWVQGRDYINPALQPVFDGIAEQAWREVTKL